MKPLKFFALDARAASTFLVVLLYMRWWTVYLCAIITFVFHVVERNGYTLPSALRALRSWIVGNHRPALMHTRRNKLIDYG